MTPLDPPRAGAASDGFVARADAVLDRVGLTTPLRRDAALAAVMVIATVGVLLLGRADPVQTAVLGGTLPAVLVLVGAQSGVLVLRRVNPVLCLGLVVGLQVVLTAVVPPGGWLRGPAPVVAAYTCGAWLPARRALAVSATAAVVETVGAVLATESALGPPADAATVAIRILGQLVSALITYVAAAVLGGYVGTRRRFDEMARQRDAEAAAAQRARTDAAVGAERARLARELHDIAAHHLAAMVVQASVAERLIDRDPQAARRTVAEVRTRGRATLHDLRLVVGALRERGDGDGAAREEGREGSAPEDGVPVPGLAVLDDLVAGAGDGPVELRVVGTPRELPPVADVSFYRVAQEALSNARDHAPGAPVTVRVEHGDAATVLEVRNGLPRPGAPTRPDRGQGLGLVGMRERAALIGADLTAGPDADGGWRVRLALAHEAGGSA